MKNSDLILINEYLKRTNMDAYVLVDYENKNKTILSFLGEKMLTRKIFVVFPKNEKPYLICHNIDKVFLDVEEITSNFDLRIYYTWQEMLSIQKDCFSKYKNILMDISENGLLMRVSLADYGSVEYIKSLGIDVHSSGDLLQSFTATYDSESYQSQLRACEKTLKIKDEAFSLIKDDILKYGESDEYRIQKFICDRFHSEGMIYDDPAIVAISHNASNPHYGPTKEIHSKIKEGDVVLIDMWAKENTSKAVYADITWMGYVGKVVPDVVKERFLVLRKAVDEAFEFLKKNLPIRDVYGYEVDDVTRKIVRDAGYIEYFTHRTGHNISVDVSPHGPGVNIDDYETHDDRKIIENISFSLEPGIYAPDFGMRVETDIYIDDNKVPHMVAGRQEEVIAILK